MTNVRLGDPARVTVDAFPDLALTGHVDSWSPGTGSTFALLPPDNATGNFTKVVQRVPVKIVLDPNPALGTLVRPGMSVEATIDTGPTENREPTPGSTQKSGPDRPAAHDVATERQMSLHLAPVSAAGRALHALTLLHPRLPREFSAPLRRYPWRAAWIDHRVACQPGDQLWAGRSARRPACRLRRGCVDHHRLRHRPDGGRRRLALPRRDLRRAARAAARHRC